MPGVPQDLFIYAVLTAGRIKLLWFSKIHSTTGQIGGDTRLQHSFGDGIGVHIHIRDTGSAASNHLGQPQSGARGNASGIQLVLGREDIVVQPVVQVVSASVPPQEGHGHMSVGVDQAGHEHLAGPVNDPVKLPLGAGSAHRGDFCALHRYKCVFQDRLGRVHGHSGDMFQQQ